MSYNIPTRRIAKGAGVEGLQLVLIPVHERRDFSAATMRPEDLVFVAVDVFTTLNGSWDAQQTQPVYGIEQWARDAYLFSPNHPRYNPSAGGDHNSFGLCIDPAGNPYPDAGFIWTSDGPQHLQPPVDASKVVTRNGEAPHGWANIPVWATDPATNPPTVPGPWSIAKFGPADIVVGIGMPYNWHVSTFVVWRAVRWGDYSGGAPGPGPGPGPEPTSDLDMLVALAVPQMAGNRAPATIAQRALDVLAVLKEQ